MKPRKSSKAGEQRLLCAIVRFSLAALRHGQKATTVQNSDSGSFE